MARMNAKVKHVHDYIKRRTKRADVELHCDTGPALVFPDGTVAWMIHNNQYSFEGWCNQLKIPKDERIRLKMLHG